MEDLRAPHGAAAALRASLLLLFRTPARPSGTNPQNCSPTAGRSCAEPDPCHHSLCDWDRDIVVRRSESSQLTRTLESSSSSPSPSLSPPPPPPPPPSSSSDRVCPGP
eukprot:2192495-Rhodomonas_salina.2